VKKIQLPRAHVCPNAKFAMRARSPAYLCKFGGITVVDLPHNQIVNDIPKAVCAGHHPAHKKVTIDALSQVGNDCMSLRDSDAQLGVDRCTDTKHALVNARGTPTGRVGCRGAKFCACLNMWGRISWAWDNQDTGIVLGAHPTNRTKKRMISPPAGLGMK